MQVLAPLETASLIEFIIVNSCLRYSLQRMRSIRSSSATWRATCSFPTYKSDITRDYVKAQLQEFDVIEYTGAGCKMVDSINIRGHSSSRVLAAFFQSNNEHIHTDSAVGYAYCPTFDARQGSVTNEDNFGHYFTTNPTFRCTESAGSTTQYWLGSAK